MRTWNPATRRRGAPYAGRSSSWTATLGDESPPEHATVARTVRMRLISMPGRLVNLAGAITLRGPLDWPWAEWCCRRLECLRGLQLSTG